MKFMWLRFAILRILNRIWPPEQPTIEELLEQINVLQAELRKYQERTYVWIDPTIYHTGAYDAPSPTTDGKMRAEHIEMIRTQHALPAVVSPLRKSRFAKLIHDAVPLPGDTAYSTPAFLKDQTKP